MAFPDPVGTDIQVTGKLLSYPSNKKRPLARYHTGTSGPCTYTALEDWLFFSFLDCSFKTIGIGPDHDNAIYEKSWGAIHLRIAG